jgi:uncharacterized protein (DUF736 family)
VVALNDGPEVSLRKIGTFTRDGDGFRGSIVTLSVQALDVRIEPRMTVKQGDPSHIVLIGGATLGAAWSRPASRGNAVLELELDDPSFAAPISAELIPSADDGNFDLIWHRT